jgi:hypothetical protein
MIDSVVDKMISTIQTGIASLGGTASTPVVEGDEEPHLVRTFPSIFIIPLIEGGDRMETKMGGVSHRFHNFSITIIGMYRAGSVAELLRTTRQYGYIADDMFTSNNYKIIGTKGAAVVVGSKLDVGYHRVGDKIVHTWAVKLDMKSMTP